MKVVEIFGACSSSIYVQLTIRNRSLYTYMLSTLLLVNEKKHLCGF